MCKNEKESRSWTKHQVKEITCVIPKLLPIRKKPCYLQKTRIGIASVSSHSPIPMAVTMRYTCLFLFFMKRTSLFSSIHMLECGILMGQT